MSTIGRGLALFVLGSLLAGGVAWLALTRSRPVELEHRVRTEEGAHARDDRADASTPLDMDVPRIPDRVSLEDAVVGPPSIEVATEPDPGLDREELLKDPATREELLKDFESWPEYQGGFQHRGPDRVEKTPETLFDAKYDKDLTANELEKIAVDVRSAFWDRVRPLFEERFQNGLIDVVPFGQSYVSRDMSPLQQARGLPNGDQQIVFLPFDLYPEVYVDLDELFYLGWRKHKASKAEFAAK